MNFNDNYSNKHFKMLISSALTFLACFVAALPEERARFLKGHKMMEKLRFTVVPNKLVFQLRGNFKVASIEVV